MEPSKRNLVCLIGIVLIVIFIAIAIVSHEKNNDDFNFPNCPNLLDQSNYNLLGQPNCPETECIYREYEVLNVYRMFDGYRLRYGVDYIDNEEIKTLIFPDMYQDSSITIYPSNITYLMYRERWFVFKNGKKELRDDNLEYKLYLSNNTDIIGTSTHYSRSRESDFDSTVIIIKENET
ncbi:hypothetical protein KAU33_02575 [Candidatus Dependentiae bacterium]|nr:hypothetical protein [Candidatus Dependentiae bacterium]